MAKDGKWGGPRPGSGRPTEYRGKMIRASFYTTKKMLADMDRKAKAAGISRAKWMFQVLQEALRV